MSQISEPEKQHVCVCVRVTFDLVVLGLQLHNVPLLQAHAAAAQQLLKGGAKRWVNGLGRVDGQQQNQNPEVLMEKRG